MNCGEFKELVWEYPEREITPETVKRAKEHLSTCSACRQELETVSDIRGGFVKVSFDADAVARKILGKVTFASKKPVKNKKFMRFTLPLSAVATVLFVLLVVSMWPQPTSAVSLDDFMGHHLVCLRESHHEGYTCNTEMEFSERAIKELGLKPLSRSHGNEKFVAGEICSVNNMMAAHAIFSEKGQLVSRYLVKGAPQSFVKRSDVVKLENGLFRLSKEGHEMVIYERGDGDFELFISDVPIESLIDFVRQSL